MWFIYRPVDHDCYLLKRDVDSTGLLYRCPPSLQQEQDHEKGCRIY